MGKGTTIVVSSFLTATGIFFYWRFRRLYIRNNRIVETIFIRPLLQPCCPQDDFNSLMCGQSDCPKAKFKQLEKHIDSAKTSIKVLMFAFTMHELGSALIRAHKRGVNVVVIGDNDMKSINDSQLKKLQKSGLSVHWPDPKTSKIMHHKTCVIDSETDLGVAIVGSLNWTRAAFTRNYEHIIVMSNKLFVDEMAEEFNAVLAISLVATWN